MHFSPTIKVKGALTFGQIWSFKWKYMLYSDQGYIFRTIRKPISRYFELLF